MCRRFGLSSFQKSINPETFIQICWLTLPAEKNRHTESCCQEYLEKTIYKLKFWYIYVLQKLYYTVIPFTANTKNKLEDSFKITSSTLEA